MDKDPLQNIRNSTSVRYVMKNGEVFDGNTLDEIWPAQKKLAPLYWWSTDPKPLTTSHTSKLGASTAKIPAGGKP